MQTRKIRLIAARLLAILALAFFWSEIALAEAYFDRYGLLPASPAVDLGTQPLGYPSGVISAVMQHDRILKKALADRQLPLKTHPFRRGADMVALLTEQRLEAGLLGDMPTIVAASTGNVWIVGLVKQTSTAIVTKGDVQVRGLTGKRIGYVEVSSAHHTLLQALASAGLNERQVKLVALGVDEMPDALERGDIDAFSAWEPAPSVALAKNDKNRIVSRGLSTDYFVIERHFAERAPEAARQVVAGFIRAIEWMRRSQRNVETAVGWAMADAEALSGKPAALSVAQIVSIIKRDILNIPSAPAILSSPGKPPLKDEFQFLTSLGKLPPGGKWENVEAALSYDGLARVIAAPRVYQLNTFDYAD
jgi:ABC-type nitrate/sulfonate/bicarbonate transport system substrate-binding protein